MQICTNYAQISPFLSKKNPAGDHLFGLRESDSLLKFSACRKMVSVLGFLPSCASGAAPVSNSPKRGFDLAAKSKTPVGSFILWGGCLEGCIWGGGLPPPPIELCRGAGKAYRSRSAAARTPGASRGRGTTARRRRTSAG